MNRIIRDAAGRVTVVDDDDSAQVEAPEPDLAVGETDNEE